MKRIRFIAAVAAGITSLLTGTAIVAGQHFGVICNASTC